MLHTMFLGLLTSIALAVGPGPAVKDADVLSSSVESHGPAARPSAHSDRGGIVIWKDESLAPASNPEHLASVLRQAGYGVTLLSRAEIADRRVLRADRCELVVLPYGTHYPHGPDEALSAYLRAGGSLLTLGGPCLREPIGPDVKPASKPLPPRPVVEFSKELLAKLNASSGKGENPATLSLAADARGESFVDVAIHDLTTYYYVPLTTTGAAGYEVLHFRARGDAETQFLCLELNEADGSRWKALVELSPDWQAFDVPIASFVAYATKDRGAPGDRVHAAQVRRVALGFPATLAGKGPRRFAIGELQWRWSSQPGTASAAVPLLFEAQANLRRAFGKALKLPPPGGITLYHRSPAFRSASLTAAPGQEIFPQDIAIAGPICGTVPTILEDNLLLLRATEAGRKAHLPTERLVRTIPLLVTPAGETAAALFVHLGGPYAGSRWAAFGVTSPDVFPAGNAAADAGLVATVDTLLHRDWIAKLEPRFLVRQDQAVMEVCVRTLVPNGRPAKGQIHARLFSAGGSQAVLEKTIPVDLAPGRSGDIVVLEAEAARFDATNYRVECELRSEDRLCDRAASAVDVRATLLAICDRLVRTQADRGDGKFSGIGFVDNRGVRGLLAAYEICGNRQYLDAAIRWGHATIAEQRPDGGYRMGYGYHKDGDECFVADGGEIACGVARLVSYIPQGERQRFRDSLRAYMAYRESFRCEGGGIGVGWCRTDFGQRPTVPLKQITKIFAPEKNTYTIGCTLAAATMYAQLTGDPQDAEAAIRDARWLMARCDRTVTGAFVESIAWAHGFLPGVEIRGETEQFLRKTFLPYVTPPEIAWWRGGEGRNVQALDGLAYFYDVIQPDPAVRAALLCGVWNVASPQSLCGVAGVLQQKELILGQWMYLCFAAVSLPDVVRSEIVRKKF